MIEYDLFVKSVYASVVFEFDLCMLEPVERFLLLLFGS